MSRYFMQTSCAVLLLASVVFCASAAARATRSIAIQINLLDPAGNAIADTAVNVMTKSGWGAGVTDANGFVEVTVDASDTEDDIALVRIHNGGRQVGISDLQRDLLLLKYREVMDQYACRAWDPVPINETDLVYQYDYMLSAAVTVTGVFQHESTGDPIAGVICGIVNQAGIAMSGSSGDFSLLAITGAPAQLMYTSPDSNRIGVVELSDVQLANDHDLGTISVPEVSADSECTIAVPSPPVRLVEEKTLNTLEVGVTLISTDGQAVYCFARDEAEAMYVSRPWDSGSTTAELAAGTYYIAPGYYGYEISVVLRAALLDNRQGLLDAAGVPTVTVSPSQSPSLVFDPVQSQTAILSVASDLLP